MRRRSARRGVPAAAAATTRPPRRRALTRGGHQLRGVLAHGWCNWVGLSVSSESAPGGKGERKVLRLEPAASLPPGGQQLRKKAARMRAAAPVAAVARATRWTAATGGRAQERSSRGASAGATASMTVGRSRSRSSAAWLGGGAGSARAHLLWAGLGELRGQGTRGRPEEGRGIVGPGMMSGNWPGFLAWVGLSGPLRVLTSLGYH